MSLSKQIQAPPCNERKKHGVFSRMLGLANLSDSLDDIQVTASNLVSPVKDVASSIMQYIKGLSMTETVLDVLSGFISLAGGIAEGLPTPLRVLLSISGVYTVISKSIKGILCILRESMTKEVYEEIEMEVTPVTFNPQVLDAFTGLSLMALIKTFLPQTVIQTLMEFSRMSSIRILDDFSWLGKIWCVMAHVPGYILRFLSTRLYGLGTKHQIQWMVDLSGVLVKAEESYEHVLDKFPLIRQDKLIQEMDDICREAERKDAFQSLAFHDRILDVAKRSEDMVETYRTLQTVLPKNFKMSNDAFQSVYLTFLSRTEPIRITPAAFVVTGKPGTGKTVWSGSFINALLNSDRSISLYTYTSVIGQSSKPWYDGYRCETIMLHNDIGINGMPDFIPYMSFIESSPAKMPVAEAKKKDITYFRSSMIWATSNCDMVNKAIPPSKDCALEETDAIYRRWHILHVKDDPTFTEDLGGGKRKLKKLTHYRFNSRSERYEEKATYDVDDMQSIMNLVDDVYQENKQLHDIMRQAKVDKIFNTPRFRAQVGRYESELNLDSVQYVAAPTPVKPAEYDEFIGRNNDVSVLNLDTAEEEQFTGSEIEITQQYIDRGYYINGIQNPKLPEVSWPILVCKNLEKWTEYMTTQVESMFSWFMDKVTQVAEVARVGIQSIAAKIGWSGVIFGSLVALALVASIAVFAHYLSKDKVHEKFVHRLAQARPWENKKRSSKNVFKSQAGSVLKADVEETPQMKAVKQNVVQVQVLSGEKNNIGHGVMMDAYTLVLPAHVAADEYHNVPEHVFVKARRAGVVMYESTMSMVDFNLTEDYAIYTFTNPTVPLFRKLRLEPMDNEAQTMVMTAPQGYISLGRISASALTGVYFSFNKGVARVGASAIEYDPEEAGLCGSLIISSTGYIFGWHVAESSGSGVSRGYGRPWSQTLRKRIAEGADIEPTFKQDMKSDITGALPVRYHYTPIVMDSSLVPSPMQGVVPAELLTTDPRVPAVISPETFKVGQKKNLKDYNRGDLSTKAADFATRSVEKLLDTISREPLKELNQKELVHGLHEEDHLCRLNKDASAGVPLGGLVSDHVNFETDSFSRELQERMDLFHKDFQNGVKDIYSVIFKDCPKDEMRNEDKREKPRVFAAAPLHFTIAVRRLFGRLCARATKARFETGIMIGINAASTEWQKLYMYLIQHKYRFDGDFSSWDGAMLKLAQERVNGLLSSKCVNTKLAQYVLSFLSQTTRSALHETYLTSHSIPSGHGITSFYNSLINKWYLAYAWYELVGQFLNMDLETLIEEYDRNVCSVNYGDDLAVSVSEKYSKPFNAMTYTTVMETLGIGFTAADKKPHTKPFCSMYDITFLKRSFRFHEQLQCIVGPLDMRTLEHSLLWMDSRTTETVPEIMKAKMASLQLELYLHGYSVYQKRWPKYKESYANAMGLPYTDFSVARIQDIVTIDDPGAVTKHMLHHITPQHKKE